jgi:hypothetical protein
MNHQGKKFHVKLWRPKKYPEVIAVKIESREAGSTEKVITEMKDLKVSALGEEIFRIPSGYMKLPEGMDVKKMLQGS